MPRFRFRTICCLLLLCIIALSTAWAQDPDEKPGRPDNPAGRQLWFMKGRQTRNGEPPAKMLHKAQVAKMQMRAARMSKIRAAATRGQRLSGTSGLVNPWTALGPKPINDSTTYATGYGSLAGRVTAIAVDQKDSTGNTVLAAGAYGGVWKSTNAAAADPTLVKWTPLIDDQATLSVGSIAIQPGATANVVLVGTGEPNYAGDSYYGVGILRSTDGGSTWSTISSVDSGTHSLYGMGVSQIAFSTKSPNVVVASVSKHTMGSFFNAAPSNAQDGVMYSIDAGATWKSAGWSDDNGSHVSFTSVSSVIYNPTEDKFYAAVPFHGFYVSNNTASAGFTYFTRLTNQPGASGKLSLTSCPTSGSTSCPMERGALTVRPVLKSGDPNQMYAWFVATGDGSTGDDQGIWQSSTSNSGTVTWTQITDTGITNCGDGGGCGTNQSFYNFYISAVPNGSGTDLYAGTINIYKCSITSTNPTCSATGSGFQNLTHAYGCATIAMVHPDQHGIDFLQSNPNIIYFGNDGGVNRALTSFTKLNTGTCPSGTTQANAFDNLNTNIGALSQFVWGAQHPTDPSTLMGGTQDNGTMGVSGSRIAPGEAGWWEVDNGDGGYTQIDPNTPNNWYTEYYGVSIQNCPSGINCDASLFPYLIAEDSSQSLSQTDGDDGNFYVPFILDPAIPTNLIVGTCRVWRGPNDTKKWPNGSTANAISHKLFQGGDTSCNGSSGDDEIQGLAAGGPSGTAGSKVIWATTSGTVVSGAAVEGHVYMTTNATTGFATWNDVTGTINPDKFPISGVAMDPHDQSGMTAVVTIQGFTNSGVGHVWRTINGGSSWSDITGNLINIPVNDVVVDPDNANTIYVATDTGVWVTNDLATWTEVGPSAASGSGFLPNVTVFHIAIYEKGADKRLRAWTHGRGAWETVLPSSVITGVTTSTSGLSFTSTTGTKTAAQTVTLTNNDGVAVTLGAAVFSGTNAADFAVDGTSTTCTTSLAASATCKLGITYKPAAAGSSAASVSVTTTGVGTPTVTVNLSGTATAPAATDFSFDATSTTTATVAAGAKASYSLVIDSNPTGTNFSSAVTFTCSGLPSKTACSFSPSSVTSAGTVTLSISTTATTTTATHRASANPPSHGVLLAAALGFPGLLFFVPGMFGRSRRQRLLMYVGMVMLFGMILGMAACGGGGGGGGGFHTTVPGTPSGTYSVTVTGQYGSTTHTQTVTLTVQ